MTINVSGYFKTPVTQGGSVKCTSIVFLVPNNSGAVFTTPLASLNRRRRRSWRPTPMEATRTTVGLSFLPRLQMSRWAHQAPELLAAV